MEIPFFYLDLKGMVQVVERTEQYIPYETQEAVDKRISINNWR